MLKQNLVDDIVNHNESKKGFEAAFGLWKNKDLDSLEYQVKLRDEWLSGFYFIARSMSFL